MQLLQPADNSGILPIAYFHALARLGEEGLILIEPAQPFVSLGFFDDAATTLDRHYCETQNIPVMRRETGGGMVLLGPGQVFYTLVIKRPHHPIPSGVDQAYAHLSQAPIAVYREFGIQTKLRPVNDIVTESGRKIAGQGAGDINGFFCFVGSILTHFDVDLMHRIVKLPNEDLRAPLKIALGDHLTSISRETQTWPTTETVKYSLARAFAPLVGGLFPATASESLVAQAREVAAELSAPETLLSEETKTGSLFKVREGLYLCQRALTHHDGQILVSLTIQDEHIESASLAASGLTLPELPNLDRLIGKLFRPDVVRAHLPDMAVIGLGKDRLIDALFAKRS
ncbi:MAG: lipoate--protein ligase family protein [Acidiferrobacter sp.]